MAQKLRNQHVNAMKKLNQVVTVALVFCASSCQNRTVCRTKTSTGTSFARLYANNYDTPDDYTAAIDTLKVHGYTCDDSTMAQD